MTPPNQRSLIAGLIVLGILFVGFFGFRALFAFGEFRKHGPPPPLNAVFTEQPMETDVELIRDWMTVSYIAATYRVHPKILFDALGINPRDNNEKSLAQLNEEFFPDKPGIVIELVKTVVMANQSISTPIIPDTPAPPSVP